jgi:DNA repair protein RadC
LLLAPPDYSPRRAHGISVSHNHSSGSTQLCLQDTLLTEKLKNACKTVGIELLDHLILTEDNYMSFADEGLL